MCAIKNGKWFEFIKAPHIDLHTIHFSCQWRIVTQKSEHTHNNRQSTIETSGTANHSAIKKKSKTAIESEWVRALVSDSFILVAWNKSSHINRKESLSLLVAWNFRRKTHEKTKIGWRKPKLLKIIPYLHSPFYIWERQRVWAINQENRNRREKKMVRWRFGFIILIGKRVACDLNKAQDERQDEY